LTHSQRSLYPPQNHLGWRPPVGSTISQGGRAWIAS